MTRPDNSHYPVGTINLLHKHSSDLTTQAGRELRRLNECRMFLQVTTLADIVDAGGSLISVLSWQENVIVALGFTVNGLDLRLRSLANTGTYGVELYKKVSPRATVLCQLH
jgi:hypothetical protein